MKDVFAKSLFTNEVSSLYLKIKKKFHSDTQKYLHLFLSIDNNLELQKNILCQRIEYSRVTASWQIYFQQLAKMNSAAVKNEFANWHSSFCSLLN